MKHYSLLAALLMLMLTGCNRHAEQMLSALEQQGVGLIVENNGETTTYCQHGVKDLLYLMLHQNPNLQQSLLRNLLLSRLPNHHRNHPPSHPPNHLRDLLPSRLLNLHRNQAHRK